MAKPIDKVRDMVAYQLVVEHNMTQRKALEKMHKMGIKIGKTTLHEAVHRVKKDPEAYKNLQ